MTNPQDWAANPWSTASLAAWEQMTVPSGFLAQWQNLLQGQNLAQWQNLAQSVAQSLQGSIAGSASPGAAFPALGPAREHARIAQTINELTARLQASCAEFAAHLSGIRQETLRAIQTHPAPTYDAWIESAESAYATLAHSTSFARLLGEICNTVSALKVQRGKLLEYLSRQLDLPTRAEVDSLHQQVRLLREQVQGQANSHAQGPAHEQAYGPAHEHVVGRGTP